MDKLAIRPIREPVFICHADCQDSVDYVKGLLYERFGVTDVRADYIGPVIEMCIRDRSSAGRTATAS